MTVVTRFPPSPTGLMHIGNARTALFNWLYARKHGGKFLFRIEDTDRKRHSEEAVQAIINGLNWLELGWDGEIVSQFARMDRHAEIAKQMVAKGEAYYCYCSPEELEAMREKALAEKSNQFYDRRWRDPQKLAPPEGVKPTIRIKSPIEGETTIHDEVQGTVTMKNDQLDDFIILRSDGTPTYMLSVVVDDHDMGVTHIIRGDDHLNNAFRQKVIFDAMGWAVPVFAHVPLIHGPDGGKFSKRHGAQSVEEYREMGYLPEAMRNYLLRLGWSHGDEDILSTARAMELFDLSGIGRSASRFDFAKLENVNAHYLKEIDNQRLLTIAAPLYQQRHGIALNDKAKAYILAGVEELKSRAKTVVQFVDESVFYAKTAPLDYDDSAAAALQEAGPAILKSLYETLNALPDFTAASIQNACKTIAASLAEGKMGKIAMPLRAALTGRTISPTVFNVAEILGQEESLNRLKHAINAADK
jgi:glutamyl-tRNA synthetase